MPGFMLFLMKSALLLGGLCLTVLACSEQGALKPIPVDSFVSGHVQYEADHAPAPGIEVELLESYWDGGIPPGETFRTIASTCTAQNGYFNFDFTADSHAYKLRVNYTSGAEVVAVDRGVTEELIVNVSSAALRGDCE
jgi:hypothetical protein